MDTPTIRKRFLEYFAERGHTTVPSSSLIPDDPTLLLTNAGMVQFKPYFLGQKVAPYPRAASVQKCFREIDIEEVGKTARHLTFFEMLGNFSFGDYFKAGAIRLAWDLITDGFALDIDRLWVTVFEQDDEAAQIWEQEIGIAPGRILRRTAADGNFWDMGIAGPCGPCSEILYDRGEAFGQTYSGGDLDEARYLEVWNLVFMQSIRDDKGEIVGELPMRNVDTGMGLERLASILQDVPSIFEVDSMASILATAQELTGHSYGQSEQTDMSLRVLSEHARAMTFLIADGVLPGNVGRGYVLRRLIRRAVRYARLVGVDKPLLGELTDTAIGLYGSAYAEVDRNRQLIQRVVEKEESRFNETLRQGLGLLEEAVGEAKTTHSVRLSGEVVFKLHDTYGFPLDLTKDIAGEEGLTVDMDAFHALMTDQRERARAARGGAVDEVEDELLTKIRESGGRTEFVGYERLVSDSSVVAIVDVSGMSVAVLNEGERGELVLRGTPFYPEGGGQVADRGTIRSASGTFDVSDVRWGVPGLAIHRGVVGAGTIVVDDEVESSVDPLHRQGVRQSHTATHMVHWALREVLGEHAKQQGSLVEPGRMRFDFSHFEAVSPDELAGIEESINAKVHADDSVRAFETTFDQAMSLGAMALFGEKYGNDVRLVEVGDYSKELCGGTHVSHTGEIGLIKMVHEGSVAAGVRRVEALTGSAGLDYLNGQLARLHEISSLLKTEPEKLTERVSRMLETIKALESEIARTRDTGMEGEIDRILASDQIEVVGGSKLISMLSRDSSVDGLRRMAMSIRGRIGSGVAILACADDGSANIVVSATRDLVAKGVDSGKLAASAAALLGGGGGGKPDLAVAGGPRFMDVAEALASVTAQARKLLGA